MGRLSGVLNKLNMAKKARLARADNQGYFIDLPAYHGTNQDIDAFSLSKGGDVSGSPVGSLGVSLAVDPDVANEFSSLAGNEGANVIQAFHRAGRPVSIELPDQISNYEVAATVQQAWDEGFDAIKFTNYTTPGGQKGKTFYLVRNPNQIRSVNAAFDPEKQESANLLAGVAGAAIALPSIFATPEARAALDQFNTRRKNRTDPVFSQAGMSLEYGQGLGYAIEPVRFPVLHDAADMIDKVETPLGPVAPGVSQYLREFGEETSLKRKAANAFGAALDTM